MSIPISDGAHTATILTTTGKSSHGESLELVAQMVTRNGGVVVGTIRRYPRHSAIELDVRGLTRSAARQVVRTMRAERSDLDVGMSPTEARGTKRLVVFDVDSTVLQGEVLDELADRAGQGQRCRALTTRAMHGEMDFAQSIQERVALLAGLPHAEATACVERMPVADGADAVFSTLREAGHRTALVSGGFTIATSRLRARFGIDYEIANNLEIVDGTLTGRLCGPLVDRAAKARHLREIAMVEGVPLPSVVAVGDGANDLDMLASAGLGVAYCAKPCVRDAADASISEPRLDRLLGYLSVGAPVHQTWP